MFVLPLKFAFCPFPLYTVLTGVAFCCVAGARAGVGFTAEVGTDVVFATKTGAGAAFGADAGAGVAFAVGVGVGVAFAAGICNLTFFIIF